MRAMAALEDGGGIPRPVLGPRHSLIDKNNFSAPGRARRRLQSRNVGKAHDLRLYSARRGRGRTAERGHHQTLLGGGHDTRLLTHPSPGLDGKGFDMDIAE